MTKILRAELDRAAFWEHAFCLDCGLEQEPRSAADPECDECDSTRVLLASTILDCAAFIEEDE